MSSVPKPPALCLKQASKRWSNFIDYRFKREPERRKCFMSEENKALARRSWESVDDPDILEEVYAPDVV